MYWRDFPLGIVLTSGLQIDVPAIVEQFDFVVLYYGKGVDGGDRDWVGRISRALDGKIPVLASYGVLPAITNITQAQVAPMQWPYAMEPIMGQPIYAMIASMRVLDDANRVATDSNINVAMRDFCKIAHDALKIPVIVRSNDDLVTKYSPSMTTWIDNYAFWLADIRYRIKGATRDTDRYYEYKSVFPPLETTVDVLRERCDPPSIDHCPPDVAATPLCPGANRSFWEFSTSRWIFTGVKDIFGNTVPVNTVLYTGGTLEMLYSWLGFQKAVDPTPPPSTPPADGDISGQNWEVMLRGPNHFSDSRVYFNGQEVICTTLGVRIDVDAQYLELRIPLNRVTFK